MIRGAVDENRRTLHFLEYGGLIGKEFRFDFGRDQRLAVLGAVDQVHEDGGE